MLDTQSHWKAFLDVELTHSNAHYLMAISDLLEEQGYARAIDVARYLDLTRGSVSAALTALEDKGYVITDDNKFLQLSEQGMKAVNSVLSSRRIMIEFFEDVLGVSEEQAEEDACKIEHLISRETGKKLMTYLGCYKSNSPSAQAFRREFQDFTYQCDAADNCAVCLNQCYFRKEPTQLQ